MLLFAHQKTIISSGGGMRECKFPDRTVHSPLWWPGLSIAPFHKGFHVHKTAFQKGESFFSIA